MKESGNEMKQTFLASLFNRKKYESKWESCLIFGVKMKNIQNDHLDPGTNVITFSSNDWSCFFVLVSSLAHRFLFANFQRPLSLVLWLSLGSTLPMRNSQYPEISLQNVAIFYQNQKRRFCTRLKVKTIRKI